MTPEVYKRVRVLFDEALNLPEPARLPYLRQECAEDAEIFAHVADLLRAHRESQSFLQENEPRESQFGRYRITEVIGRGAMGIVYGAHDPAIHRQIAIKVIQLHTLTGEKDAAFLRERLYREAHLAGSLSHPGIVTIYDLGEFEGQPFIAMERVWGPSLQALLDSRRGLTPVQSLDILRQIAAALDYAHAHRVVHRDVKPSNILLQDGNSVKVVDFGIAKILSAQEQTLTGLGAGTPSYMSPEQIKAEPADGRSDQFSLAVMAFEMLAGVKPFTGDSAAAILHAIAFGDRPSAHLLNSALPAQVDSVFLRALKSRPADRYNSCGEFVLALELALSSKTSAAVGHARPQAKALTSAQMLGLCFAFALLILAALWYRLQPPASQPLSTAKLPESPPGATVDLLRMAADAGDSNSMVDLGDMYSTAAGVSQNGDEAVRWYREAANAGNVQGMLDLGGIYMLGNGIAKDEKLAASWFQQAADLGNPSATFDLGWLYENGQGVSRNLQTAATLYRRAAALGNNEARRKLAQMPTSR
jgi:eukaryotic-like serine/threonine-protein kinase